MIAKAAMAAFGGQPKVHRYWDSEHKRYVDMVQCIDSPWRGVTSYSTVGVSRRPLFEAADGVAVTLEFVGAAGSLEERIANALATAGFIIESGTFVGPGSILEDIVVTSGASKSLPHFLFIPPFLWDGKLSTLELERQRVAWLLAVPISDGEKAYALRDGVPALEAALEANHIDIFDLERPSVV